MAITFVCPCGKHLRARNEQAGRRILCPACGTPVTIPALDAPVPDSDAHLRASPVFPRAESSEPESDTGAARDAIYRLEPGNEPAPVRHAEVPCPDLGPIFFRFRPSRGNPNGDFGGKWVPLDDTVKPPPDERARKRLRRTRRQIAWRLETSWLECLLYPFRAWPLLVGLGAGLGIVAAFMATHLARPSEPMTEEGGVWDPLFRLLGPAIVGYTIAFLDCVVTSAAAGEYLHVRWPGRSVSLVLRSCLTWLLCFLAGPVVFAGVALLYWSRLGDPDVVDQLILGELSAVAAGYWLLAIVVAAESRSFIAGPEAVAELFRRLGLKSCGALLAALTIAYFVGRLGVSALEEYHRNWFAGGFLLVCAGVAGVYLAVFCLRYLGIRAFHTRPAPTG